MTTQLNLQSADLEKLRNMSRAIDITEDALQSTAESKELLNKHIRAITGLSDSIASTLRPIVIEGLKTIWDGNGTDKGSAYILSALLDPEQQDYRITRWVAKIRSFAYRCGLRFIPNTNKPMSFKIPKGVLTWEEMQAFIDAVPFEEKAGLSANERKAQAQKAKDDKAEAWQGENGYKELDKALYALSKRTHGNKEIEAFLIHIVANRGAIQATLANMLARGELSDEIPAYCTEKKKKN